MGARGSVSSTFGALTRTGSGLRTWCLVLAFQKELKCWLGRKEERVGGERLEIDLAAKGGVALKSNRRSWLGKLEGATFI